MCHHDTRGGSLRTRTVEPTSQDGASMTDELDVLPLHDGDSFRCAAVIATARVKICPSSIPIRTSPAVSDSAIFSAISSPMTTSIQRIIVSES